MGAFDWSTSPDANSVADPLVPSRDGTAARDFPRSVRGVQAGVAAYAQDQGGALVARRSSGNVYAVTTRSKPDALSAGFSCLVRVDSANTSAAASLVIDGFRAYPWRDANGLDFPIGSLTRRPTRVVFDADGGQFLSDFSIGGGTGGSGPASTDALPEGANNLYFTQGRARGALSTASSGALSYNSTTGVLTFTPVLATVATSGSYADLSSKPAFASVATSGAYTDLIGRPNLSTVATSGSYTDLTNKPAFATVATSGLYSDLTGRPTLAAVATSGSAADLAAGTLPAARLPFPSATTLGGVRANVGSAGQFVNGIDPATGLLAYGTPAGGGTGGGSVNPTGTFALNDIILAGSTDGNTIKSGGAGAAFVRSFVSGIAGITFNSSTGAFSLSAPTTSVLGGVLSSTRGANQFATGVDTTGALTYAQPTFGNLSGVATAAQLPLPTATAIGGVQANAGSANQFVAGISTGTGALTFAQPSFGNLSGAATAAQLPAFTGGDVTAAAGSTALVLGTSGATAGSFGSATAVATFTVNDKGLVTASGSTTIAIPSSAITDLIANAKLAQAGAFTLKGNPTSAAASVQDAALSVFLDTIGATQGTVLYRGASAWSALSPGASGQVLTSGGASANPAWSTPAGGGNVSTSGSPTNGQLALFTGASTIQGLTALPAANFPALTGDVTTTAGSLATTLATVNSNVGTFAYASVTVNGKGLVTAVTAGAAPPTKAAGTDVRTLTDDARFLTAKSLADAMGFTPPTWAASFAPNWSANGFNQSITATGNTTLTGPFTGGTDGEPVVIEYIQDATGSRTLAFNTTYFKIPPALTITASTAANARDKVYGILRNRSGTIVCEVTGFDKAVP